MTIPTLPDGYTEANITIIKGLLFSKAFTWKAAGTPVDLTGYTFSGKIKSSPAGTTLATFVCTIISAVGGKFKFELSEVTTATLDVGVYFYSVEAEMPDTESIPVFKGQAIVRAA